MARLAALRFCRFPWPRAPLHGPQYSGIKAYTADCISGMCGGAGGVKPHYDGCATNGIRIKTRHCFWVGLLFTDLPTDREVKR